MDQNMNSGNNACRCTHHKIGPILIILFGLGFLLEATGTLSALTLSYAWPMLVIVFGIMKLTGRKCGCCAK